jgi:hypothetical protein
MADEWRVEVELGEEGHGLTLGERLKSLDLDDDARERLGDGAIVTRDGAKVFLYASTEPVAREAEKVARELVAAEGLEATIEVTRWHPVEEAWKDAATPMPETEDELAAEQARHEATEKQEGDYEWEVRLDLPSLGAARELERSLATEGLPLKRRFRHLIVYATSQEHAGELADRLRTEAPADSKVAVEPTPVPHPLSVWVSAHVPGIGRDVGIDV